jgi:hypothetical protein
MADEYSPTVVAELNTRVADNLARWMFSPSASITLLNLSENATFALRDPDGRDSRRYHVQNRYVRSAP